MYTLLLVCVFFQACNSTSTKSSDKEKEFSIKSLGKGDIDNVLDVHIHESLQYLRTLMEKLYKRNPRELKKSAHGSIEENVRRVFDVNHSWHFKELSNQKGIEALRLTFNDDFEGDRVFSFIVGLTSMTLAAYEFNTDFYMFDSVEPQKLYNLARNIEIAVWKLEHDINTSGELYLYSNSQPDEIVNLSYERLFGKLIALQDTMAVIMEGQTNRLIKKVLQKMATAVFLPI